MLVSDSCWEKLALYQAHSYTQSYLLDAYKKLQYPNAETSSYTNCPTFMYQLESASIYYKQAMEAPVCLKPILLFYGLTQLIKAALLKIDPTYPSSTSLLAHGVTSRKIKKHHYSFLQDEIKIQKNGLFSYMSDVLFHMKHLEKDRFSMEHLLAEIPELYSPLTTYKLKTGIPLNRLGSNLYSGPASILDLFHTQAPRLQEILQQGSSASIQIHQDKDLFFLIPDSYRCHSCGLLKYNTYTQTFHLSKRSGSGSENLAELMVHFLILYNLSMIARYETEWWMDLQHTKPTEDYPLIHYFLTCTQTKGPYLIEQLLHSI